MTLTYLVITFKHFTADADPYDEIAQVYWVTSQEMRTKDDVRLLGLALAYQAVCSEPDDTALRVADHSENEILPFYLQRLAFNDQETWSVRTNMQTWGRPNDEFEPLSDALSTLGHSKLIAINYDERIADAKLAPYIDAIKALKFTATFLETE